MAAQATAPGAPWPAAGRPGPRPLAHHLAVAAATWLGSTAVLPLLSGASPVWKPELRAPLAELRASLANADPDAFAAAVGAAARRRLDRFLTGIEAYRRHPYRRDLADPPVLWRDGNTRLLAYGRGRRRRGRVCILVVPSLINRAYILDLAAEHSLMRYLAARGLDVYLVDWGAPGPVERGFALTDYIAGRLEGALDAMRAAAGGPAVVVGYCMGGLLALALAQRRARDLAALVCLATPWDFHADRPAQARALGQLAGAFEPVLLALGALPVDVIQLLFAGLDPFAVIRKFLDFAGLDPGSPRAHRFVALEDWLNDGVPLAAPVARECLVGWYGANTPARGQWRVAGRPVLPAEIDLPSLVVLPGADRIVPPASARALADTLPRAERLCPAAGHIGMIAGVDAREKLWRPLADWIEARGG